MSTVQSSQADEWYPGLPDTTFGSWANASQAGLSHAKRAKQWFRSPAAMSVAEVMFGQFETDKYWIRASGYFVSPKGAPENFGYLEPMTVRSVGFGMIPVEATIQVSQRREGGYPAPVEVLLRYNAIKYPGTTRVDRDYQETLIQDSLNVRVLSVRVDDVDLGLNGDCRTETPAPVTMRGPAYRMDRVNERSAEEWFRAQDPSTYYHPTFGGQLTGTMTIPPFTGCTTTTGDDLSDLLTLSASGPDNPVIARTSWSCAYDVNGAPAPLPPGASNPKLGGEAGGSSPGMDTCAGPKPFEYPARDDR
ncbi:hypothetical protein [Nocardioides sp. W7]|uniref:hypothetical protein n=1 Tax=Nocardioides sp. W7 TaxID=2931390 RepID=UPI001FD10BBA|nr:hypothetical protein [Nocardioides sp. W7]